MKPLRKTFALNQNGIRAKGVSMVIVLVFVVILTSLGAYALRRVMLNENSSRNILDLQLAKQAAAAALRDGERDLLMPNGNLKPGAVCSRLTDRPIPPVAGDTITASTWQKACSVGQCIMGNGAANQTPEELKTAFNQINVSGGATLANYEGTEPWWPSNDPATQPPFWNNAFASKPTSGNPGPCGNLVSGKWLNGFNGGVPYGTYTGTPPLPGVWHQPEYLLERIKTGGVYFYRITARGWGLSPNSEAVVQSYIFKEVR
jgi:type IV pilus assembly protein PilX